MAYTTVDNPELFFQTKTYSGNSGTNAITFDGSENMQPDWIWIKARNHTYSHTLFDSVRGMTERLQTDKTDAEDTYGSAAPTANTNGFTLGNGAAINSSSYNYVSWNWKAGTSFTNDASATGVGTIDSTGSINTTAGFSIISYSGTGTAGTIAHGLGSTPKMIIVKVRNFATNWLVQHGDVASTKVLYLDATNAATTDSPFNDTLPTSSVFSVKTANGINASGKTYIAYCFAEKKGYSKFFSYEGNSNSDGTFVHLGFKPAFLMVKPIDDADNWVMFDNKRHDATNSSVSPYFFYANKNFAETTDTKLIDFLSNGFKIRASGNTVNRSSTFIGMAFSESPFVNSSGVANNGR